MWCSLSSAIRGKVSLGVGSRGEWMVNVSERAALACPDGRGRRQKDRSPARYLWSKSSPFFKNTIACVILSHASVALIPYFVLKSSLEHSEEHFSLPPRTPATEHAALFIGELMAGDEIFSRYIPLCRCLSLCSPAALLLPRGQKNPTQSLAR